MSFLLQSIPRRTIPRLLSQTHLPRPLPSNSFNLPTTNVHSFIRFRSFHSTVPSQGIYQADLPEVVQNLIDQFSDGGKQGLDPEEINERTQFGRGWRASDLRTKSFDELHSLWFVLIKERNMLNTAKEQAKRMKQDMIRPSRLVAVRKGLAAIKTVLGERERFHRYNFFPFNLMQSWIVSLVTRKLPCTTLKKNEDYDNNTCVSEDKQP